MLNIGCHLSSAKGYLHMGEEALALGANTFQFFTRNPRGFKAKDIDKEDVSLFLEAIKKYNFAKMHYFHFPILIYNFHHHIYILNVSYLKLFENFYLLIFLSKLS